MTIKAWLERFGVYCIWLALVLVLTFFYWRGLFSVPEDRILTPTNFLSIIFGSLTFIGLLINFQINIFKDTELVAFFKKTYATSDKTHFDLLKNYTKTNHIVLIIVLVLSSINIPVYYLDIDIAIKIILSALLFIFIMLSICLVIRYMFVFMKLSVDSFIKH
jgi:hypothetical protein